MVRWVHRIMHEPSVIVDMPPVPISGTGGIFVFVFVFVCVCVGVGVGVSVVTCGWLLVGR